MLFHSLPYLLFLPAVVLAHHVAPDRWRWLVLLFASLCFYAALGAPSLLAVLVGVAAVAWGCGLGLARLPAGPRRSLVFWAGVGTLVALLAGLKILAPALGSTLVTAGVSYFVFQALSYMADVHLEVVEPEPHAGRLLLSLALFPKLLQGPLEHSADLLPQLRAPYRFDYDGARTGLLLLTRGLLKKTAIASRAALYVDAAYADPLASGGTLLFATYAYAVQIYFDFSGYTDMALGSARMLGLRLSRNFDRPYQATSVVDFWRRWHISFSRWILNYIFKPLQLQWRSAGQVGTAAALVVTFLVSGIWHGATWSFVVWGLLHGTYLAASTFWKPRQKRLHRALRLEGTWLLRAWQTLATFHLVCLAWVFFRAPTVGEGLRIVGRVLSGPWSPRAAVGAFNASTLVTLVVAMAASAVLDRLVSDQVPCRLLAWRAPTRWAAYLALAYGLLVLYAPSDGFIYLGF